MSNEPAADASKQDVEVNIYLNETPTIFLFQQQSSVASLASPEAAEIQESNKRYKSYSPVSTQDREIYTFHLFTKNKESQTDDVAKEDVKIQLDSHQLVLKEDDGPKIREKKPIDLLREQCHPLASAQWESVSEESLKDDTTKVDFGPNSRESDQMMQQFKNFGHSLFVVERMVQQNIHLEKILSYTSPPATNADRGVENLLKFHCAQTFMRPVTDLAFNPQSVNFFAASYGAIPDIALAQHKDNESIGLICIWNILNPGQPERVIETSAIPTSIVFSDGIPFLLAAGFSDGSIALYDIKNKQVERKAMSTVETGSHEGEVGEVVFQQRTDTRDHTEAIVSVATGGRVTQWTVANGLEHKDLVTLKKLKTGSGQDGETQTLRYEDLHCISFSRSQPNTYVVGSEDGALFVCDTQYNEDFIQKLLFHFRSVLTIKFSPIAPNWFISGSCDGSAAIWNTTRTTPVAVFYLNKANFNCISWSPISGTVFAAACSDGECRIWDVSIDSVEPIAKLATYDKKEFTAIDWSPKLPVFVAGNTAGVVYLSKVVGVPSLVSGNTQEDEKSRFESVIQTMSNQE